MNPLTYISLFSSAGVGCYGFKQAGFECVATCELNIQRLDIQRANQKCRYDSGYIQGDITQESTKQKLYNEIELWKINHNTTDIDVIIATPPCQGMSTANYKKGDETKRNSLVVEAISIIKKVKPKIFILENVPAFLKTICNDDKGATLTINDCIAENLSSSYYIYSKIINFKDYGVPSSRPRTLVVATRKDCINISPLNIFPVRKKEQTVRSAIGDLPSLSFGEIDSTDIYHTFREYPKYMEDWISHIDEGCSAFDNEEEFLPYKLVNGEKHILKGAYMGNKFRRLFWDKPCACIATRNDQLASQNTIHPKDNRVLSIRELMRLMTIPDSFKWTSIDLSTLNTQIKKREFLKKNELTIRRCIGEAIPTYIIFSIATKIKDMLEFQYFVDYYNKSKKIPFEPNKNNFFINSFLIEKNLSDIKKTGSYYTPQAIVFEALSSFKPTNNQTISVLEPAVGLGAFLPQLFTLLQDYNKVEIDLCDINPRILKTLQSFMEIFIFDKEKFILNYINEDFLLCKTLKNRYDLIVSNPPFGNVTKKTLSLYRENYKQTKTKNLFALFLNKFLDLSDEIVTILPKSFLMASDYNNIRLNCQKYNIVRIVDFGVKYFKNVFVEILSIHFNKTYHNSISVENKTTGEILTHPQGYIFHDKCWLIYRNEWFDKYISQLTLGVFTFFRDRQITNKYLSDSGDIRILRSKNIMDNGKIESFAGYDKYIDKKYLTNFIVSKYLNKQVIIMPNFTYNTRAGILPTNCLPNGSIAILIPIDPEKDLNIDLSYYSTDEFRKYYSIVKNNSKFTLNIDANSIYYIGVKK